MGLQTDGSPPYPEDGEATTSLPLGGCDSRVRGGRADVPSPPVGSQEAARQAVPPFTSYPVSLQARQWALWATCRHSYNRGHKLSRALNRPSSGGTVHYMHVEPMDHIITSLSGRS